LGEIKRDLVKSKRLLFFGFALPTDEFRESERLTGDWKCICCVKDTEVAEVFKWNFIKLDGGGGFCILPGWEEDESIGDPARGNESSQGILHT